MAARIVRLSLRCQSSLCGANAAIVLQRFLKRGQGRVVAIPIESMSLNSMVAAVVRVSELALVPKSGRIIPEMGTTRRTSPASGVASALFTPVQQRVLGLLFAQPERRFQSAELIRLARGGTGAVHRQLQRLANAGLVTVSREGNQKYYAARKDAPVFPELHGLIIKTVGIVQPLRAALQPIAKQIELAFVFGSLAKGDERADSDLDLLIVSDSITYPEAYEALQEAERVVARPVNPTVMTPA